MTFIQSSALLAIKRTRNREFVILMPQVIKDLPNDVCLPEKSLILYLD